MTKTTKPKYSPAFQNLINKCKTTKWVLINGVKLRRASDRETCPLAFAQGQAGICGPSVAASNLGFRVAANGVDIASAADQLPLRKLEAKIRLALIRELKPKTVKK